MFIPSNTYQLRDVDLNIFEKKHCHEFPISHVGYCNGHLVYSSRDEVYARTSHGYKKLCELDGNVTSISVQNGLICLGSSTGSIRIIGDLKNTLRSYFEHSASINEIRVTPENTVISCSNDGTVRLFKLSDQESFKTLNFENHYVNSLDICENVLVVAANGLHFYNINSIEELHEFKFSDPISHVRFLDSNTLVFSSKNRIFLLDTFAWKCFDRVAHYREIVSLEIYNGVVYSCSSDGHLKTFTKNLEPLNDFKFTTPIVDLAVAEDTVHVALNDCSIMGLPEEKKKREKAFLQRKLRPFETEVPPKLIESSKKRLPLRDKLLRNYEYKKAFIMALDSGDMGQIYPVLKYLQDDRSLKKALCDGDSLFVERVLEMCASALQIYEFIPIVTECLIILTALYSDSLTTEESLRNLIEIISEQINRKVAFQECLIKSVSFLDCFID